MSEIKPCHSFPLVVCPKCDPFTAINHLYVLAVEAGVNVKKAFELSKDIQKHMDAALSRPIPSIREESSEEVREALKCEESDGPDSEHNSCMEWPNCGHGKVLAAEVRRLTGGKNG